jgi:hypothetical protein
MKKTTGILLLVLLCSSCTQYSRIDKKGKLDHLNYKNEFIGISLHIPEPWIVVSDSENQLIVNETIKLFSHGQQYLKDNANNAMKDNQVLLNLKNRTDSSNILIGIEKRIGVCFLPITSHKYLIQLKSVLEYLPLSYRYKNNQEQEVSFNNNKWKTLQTQYENNSGTHRQDFYFKRKGYYYILIICSYDNKKQKESIENVLKNIILF